MKRINQRCKFNIGDKVSLLSYIPIYGGKLQGVLTIKKITTDNISKISINTGNILNKRVFLLEFEGIDLKCGVNEVFFKKSNRKAKIDRFFSE